MAKRKRRKERIKKTHSFVSEKLSFSLWRRRENPKPISRQGKS